MQECLTRALAQATPWQRVRDVRAYLFTILHNVHVDRFRRPGANARSVPVEDVANVLSSPPTQHRRLEIQDLAWALDRLSEEQRQVVLLVGLEGMSYREAASVLDVPVGTVMSRLSRGRDALRRLMLGGKPGGVRVVQ